METRSTTFLPKANKYYSFLTHAERNSRRFYMRVFLIESVLPMLVQKVEVSLFMVETAFSEIHSHK